MRVRFFLSFLTSVILGCSAPTPSAIEKGLVARGYEIHFHSDPSETIPATSVSLESGSPQDGDLDELCRLPKPIYLNFERGRLSEDYFRN
jgi:hypothetical protein